MPLNLDETAAVSKKPSHIYKYCYQNFLRKILSKTTQDTRKQASNG